MEVNGVVCGEIGGKRDWKMVVTRDSRCLGIFWLDSVSVTGDVKLFMTSWGLLADVCVTW